MAANQNFAFKTDLRDANLIREALEHMVEALKDEAFDRANLTDEQRITVMGKQADYERILRMQF